MLHTYTKTWENVIVEKIAIDYRIAELSQNEVRANEKWALSPAQCPSTRWRMKNVTYDIFAIANNSLMPLVFEARPCALSESEAKKTSTVNENNRSCTPYARSILWSCIETSVRMLQSDTQTALLPFWDSWSHAMFSMFRYVSYRIVCRKFTGSVPVIPVL